jgi:hypothetical protein
MFRRAAVPAKVLWAVAIVAAKATSAMRVSPKLLAERRK